jgi:hypothetical protein
MAQRQKAPSQKSGVPMPPSDRRCAVSVLLAIVAVIGIMAVGGGKHAEARIVFWSIHRDESVLISRAIFDVTVDEKTRSPGVNRFDSLMRERFARSERHIELIPDRQHNPSEIVPIRGINGDGRQWIGFCLEPQRQVGIYNGRRFSAVVLDGPENNERPRLNCAAPWNADPNNRNIWPVRIGAINVAVNHPMIGLNGGQQEEAHEATEPQPYAQSPVIAVPSGKSPGKENGASDNRQPNLSNAEKSPPSLFQLIFSVAVAAFFGGGYLGFIIGLRALGAPRRCGRCALKRRCGLLILSLTAICVFPIGALLERDGGIVFRIENPTEPYRSRAENGEFIAIAQRPENPKLHFLSFDGIQQNVTLGERKFGKIRSHQCVEIGSWQYDALCAGGFHGQVFWGQREIPTSEISVDENVNEIDRCLPCIMGDKANRFWQITWESCCVNTGDGNRTSFALNKRPDLYRGAYRQDASEDFDGSEPGKNALHQRYLAAPPSFRWLGRGLIGVGGVGYLAAMLISANGRGNGLWMLASLGTYLAASCVVFAGLVLSSPF